MSIERLVISLYAKGMSVSDIEDELRDIYKINLSTSAVSIITNKVTQAPIEWQIRPLDRLYMIVWMDGIVFKVRESGKIVNKTVYLCVGLNNRGYKEVLGMWIGKSESSSFWMSVLTDLKARGVEDILITVTAFMAGEATYFNDDITRTKILRTAEIAGHTIKLGKKRHYLLANIALVGESIMLAMRTNISDEITE